MKYMGSKARIADELLSVMLPYRTSNAQAFVEPFCGGCAVIEKVSGRRIASDKNKYLVAMLKHLSEVGVNDLPKVIERDYYSDVRDSYNRKDGRYPDYLIGWVAFMGSFNGRDFSGGYAGHHVEIKGGKFRDYIGENIRNTLEQIPRLKGINFIEGGIDYYDLEIPPYSLIYCDPPYAGTKQYSTSKNFDYERFYEWCRKMSADGHTVFVSEYNMPPDFKCVWDKQLSTTINQTITKKPVEKLFTIS